MATQFGNRPYVGAQSENAAIAFIDRWIFVLMAAFLIAVTLTGFIPDSLMKIDAVAAGERPPFPPVMHFHALTTGAWLLLLLAQTTLVATGRVRLHRSLGAVAFILAPLVLINGILLSLVTYDGALHAAQSLPALEANRLIEGQANTNLLRLKSLILFPVLVGWALLARRTDSATHKRLMVLAPLSMLSAALARITWLPTTTPLDPIGLQLWVVVLALPMFAWDIYRTRRIQRAYVIWFALYAALSIAVELAWGERWWFAAVRQVLG